MCNSEAYAADACDRKESLNKADSNMNGAILMQVPLGKSARDHPLMLSRVALQKVMDLHGQDGAACTGAVSDSLRRPLHMHGLLSTLLITECLKRAWISRIKNTLLTCAGKLVAHGLFAQYRF